jgi:pimeloyl-[acyl-carrier protein] methyl ester esterase
LQILKETDLREVFSSCPVPIQVILGTNDTLVPITLAEKLHELRPNLPVTTFNRAGHTPFLSHKAGLLAAITVFLENPSC